MKTRVLQLLVFMFMAVVGHAQVTTSSMGGLVSDSKGEPLIGATVVAVHTQSGTTYGTVTRVDGRYTLPGLRIGGPYTITTSYVGYEENVQTDIFLNLGQIFTSNPVLSESGVLLDDLVVVASRNSLMNDKRTGAGTNISTQQLNSLPTLSRSISDFTRTTPQAKGRSFGGADSRFNNLTLDGSIFNNSFGLSDLPGGQTNSSPISLDAIEQIQVNIAPFDVREGGFTGAGINAVTRSGTNEFSGSVFVNHRNENFVGKKPYGTEINVDNFDITQAGFRIGGPIIKNKLFFFANYEIERRNDPANSGFLASKSGRSGNNVTRVAASDLDDLKSFLIEKYGYDPGVYENYNLNTGSDKGLLRLDYNLNKQNKLSFRYNFLQSNRDVMASNSGAFSGRQGNLFAMNFSNNNYIINNDIQSFIAEHNFIGSNYSNKIIAGFTANRDYRSSGGGLFPLVDILQDGRNYTSFGYEPFTPNNRLDTDTWQFRNDFTYYMGNNTITAGLNFEAFEFRNTFTPTYYGQFVYNSLNDFYAAANGEDVVLRRYQKTSSNLENSALPTAITNARMLGLYLQDEIQATNNFKVTLGIRLDVPSFANTALENKEVNDLTFNDEKGNPLKFNTSVLPKTSLLWSPRLGFNWNVFGDNSLQLRGGTGIFSGRPAFVWLSNQVGNNGILTGSVFEENTNSYPFSTDVNAYNLTPNPGQAASSYNLAIVDENFKYPQVWRTNVAADYEMPFGIVATAELIYGRDINNVAYINANLKPSEKTLNGPDNRPLYNINNAGNRVNGKIVNAILLRNTDAGSNLSATFKLERPFSNGFNYMVAYSYGNTRDIMTAGSIAASSWRDIASVNGNNLPDLAFSNNDLRNRFIGSGSYRLDYSWGSTQFGIFFQYQNQGRFSYLVQANNNSDLNGDQLTNNDLLFVPNKASDLKFEQYTSGDNTITPEMQAEAFDRFIDQDDYLSGRRGQYAERNGVLMPMVASFDLSVTQEFKFNAGGKANRIQLRADVINVANMLSNKWGVAYVPNNSSPLAFRNRDAENNPIYRFNPSLTETYRRAANLGSVWQMQLGIRYIFN